MSKKIGQAGLELIMSFEGCRLTAYKPVQTEKYYTIGFGCTNFVRNRFLLLLIPFILYILQLLISEFLLLPCVSPLVFIAYYEVAGLTPFNMFVTGIVYILCAAILLLCCWYRDRAIT